MLHILRWWCHRQAVRALPRSPIPYFFGGLSKRSSTRIPQNHTLFRSFRCFSLAGKGMSAHRACRCVAVYMFTACDACIWADMKKRSSAAGSELFKLSRPPGQFRAFGLGLRTVTDKRNKGLAGVDWLESQHFRAPQYSICPGSPRMRGVV